MATARNTGPHGADNTVSGFISNGSTWVETILLTDQDGSPLTGIDSDEWRLQLREDEESTSAVLTLSTTDGTLDIAVETDRTLFSINVPQASLSDLEGDYVLDIVSKAASDETLRHIAHGVLTVRNDPIAY